MNDDVERRRQFIEQILLCRGQLFAFIYALVHDLDDTDDLFQQSALVLWRKFDQFQPGTSFLSWASSVAQYEALNFLARKRRTPIFCDAELAAALAETQAELDTHQASARQAALAECLEQLSPAARKLVELTYGSNQKTINVAKQIGRSAQSTYKSLSRIRQKLFDCIRMKVGEEGV